MHHHSSPASIEPPLDKQRGRILVGFLVLTSVCATALLIYALQFGSGLYAPYPNISTLLLVASTYALYRSGRHAFAVNLYLTGLSLMPIWWAIAVGYYSPVTTTLTIVVVVAAAVFQRPRAPLLWATWMTLQMVVLTIIFPGTGLPLVMTVLPGSLVLQTFSSGCIVADFGQSFVSLAVLRQLPVDSVKLDTTYIQGLTNRDHDHNCAIVQALHQVATALGKTTLAAGVDHVATAQVLREMGITCTQGAVVGTPQTCIFHDGVSVT